MPPRHYFRHIIETSRSSEDVIEHVEAAARGDKRRRLRFWLKAAPGLTLLDPSLLMEIAGACQKIGFNPKAEGKTPIPPDYTENLMSAMATNPHIGWDRLESTLELWATQMENGGLIPDEPDRRAARLARTMRHNPDGARTANTSMEWCWWMERLAVAGRLPSSGVLVETLRRYASLPRSSHRVYFAYLTIGSYSANIAVWATEKLLSLPEPSDVDVRMAVDYMIGHDCKQSLLPSHLSASAIGRIWHSPAVSRDDRQNLLEMTILSYHHLKAILVDSPLWESEEERELILRCTHRPEEPPDPFFVASLPGVPRAMWLDFLLYRTLIKIDGHDTLEAPTTKGGRWLAEFLKHPFAVDSDVMSYFCTNPSSEVRLWAQLVLAPLAENRQDEIEPPTLRPLEVRK